MGRPSGERHGDQLAAALLDDKRRGFVTLHFAPQAHDGGVLGGVRRRSKRQDNQQMAFMAFSEQELVD